MFGKAVIIDIGSILRLCSILPESIGIPCYMKARFLHTCKIKEGADVKKVTAVAAQASAPSAVNE